MQDTVLVKTVPAFTHPCSYIVCNLTIWAKKILCFNQGLDDDDATVVRGFVFWLKC